MKYEIWNNVSYKLEIRPIPGYFQHIDGYRPDAVMLMSAEGEVPAMEGDVTSALEDLYMRFNDDDRPNGKIANSMSVGDVVKLGDAAFAVEERGFRKLESFNPVTRQDGVECA